MPKQLPQTLGYMHGVSRVNGMAEQAHADRPSTARMDTDLFLQVLSRPTHLTARTPRHFVHVLAASPSGPPPLSKRAASHAGRHHTLVTSKGRGDAPKLALTFSPLPPSPSHFLPLPSQQQQQTQVRPLTARRPATASAFSKRDVTAWTPSHCSPPSAAHSTGSRLCGVPL